MGFVGLLWFFCDFMISLFKKGWVPITKTIISLERLFLLLIHGFLWNMCLPWGSSFLFYSFAESVV
jgi:hypothetical protein